jgi:hypothetical protein
MISGWSANETDTTESCLMNSLRLTSDTALRGREKWKMIALSVLRYLEKTFVISPFLIGSPKEKIESCFTKRCRRAAELVEIKDVQLS